MKKRVLSGIQPTGSPHIGNYLGALKNWVTIQDTSDCIFCIVDLHSITVYQKPEELHDKVQTLAKILLAVGIDPERSSLVLQSTVQEHAELAWLLTCATPIGWLERMTQYKAKAQALTATIQKNAESLEEFMRPAGSIGAGLLQYPVLMAADILLYQADIVPVGEDQKQHVELTRDIAQRFNSLYPEHGETFTMPATHLPAVGARVMGLDDPEKKMSKSEPGAGHAIGLLDEPAAIRKKIMRATTDSKPGVDIDDPGAGVRNLLAIYQAFKGISDDETKAQFSGMRYGDLKKSVAEAIVDGLDPIQKRYSKITDQQVSNALRWGSERVQPLAHQTVQKVKRAMGLFTVD